MLIASSRRNLMTSTMICSASLLAFGFAYSAAAQTATPDAGAAVQEVVVTGSRIRSASLQSASPVLAVSSAELRAEGTVNVETLLNNLPSVVANQNSSVSNGATGTANIDLRGLGPQRTLVLIDGKRLNPGDPSSPFADVNFIPTALINRVDVLTGGAAATYGADAVAGVVNFILKRDFEGLQVDAQYGFDQHNQHSSEAATFLSNFKNTAVPKDVLEGNSSTVSILMGANSPDDKGNVTAYMQYINLQPILQGSRDYSACTLTDITSVKGVANGAHGCAGSSNTATGRFRPIGVTGAGPGYTTTTAGTFVPYNSSYAFNYGPFNYYQRADDRYDFGASGHYQVNKSVDIYTDLMAMDDHTIAQIAPSGLFQGPTYYVPCNNQFLSTQEATLLGCGGKTEITTGVNAGSVPTLIGYRFANAPRQDDLRHTDYRLVVGGRGDLGDGWTYDAFAQYGESIYNENYRNDASISKIQNALNGCTNGDASCVPINIFKAGALTQAMLNYVLTPSFKTGSTTEQIVEADVTGNLGKYGLTSPLAHEGIGVAFGTDYRRESLVEKVDLENSSGDLSGAGASTQPASGSFNVYELYNELKVPLAQDLPLIKSLTFDGGYRFSDYSDVGDTSTYKVDLVYAPVSDLRFRASFNRAVRAPTIDELYTPNSFGDVNTQDPCANSDTTGKPTATAAACARTGVTAAQYGNIANCPSTQCSALTGGNAALKPETADTTSFGIVFTPSFIRGLTLTVDWFDINVRNTVSSIPASVAITQCLNTGLSEYCSLIHRDPASGSLLGPGGYVITTNVNTGFERTKGYDLEANYHYSLADRFAMNLGAIDLNFVGTYESEFIVQPFTGSGTYNCAGLYGIVCDQPRPYWRSKLRTTWTTPWKASISGQWRYVGGVKLDTNESNALLNNGAYDAVDAKVPGFNYFDLSGDYQVTDTMTVDFTCNNVLDKDPPILSTAALGSFGNGNTYPGTWDSLGRTFTVSLHKKF